MQYRSRKSNHVVKLGKDLSVAFVAATLSLCISEMASLWSAGWSAVL